MPPRFAAPLVALALSPLWSPAALAYDPRAGALACADCHGEGAGEEPTGPSFRGRIGGSGRCTPSTTGGLGHAAFENGAWGTPGQGCFPNAYYPSVAVDARNPHAAFGHGAVSHVSASGSTWGDPVTVQASAAYLPILTASPNALHLAYVDTLGGNSEVYYRTRALAVRNPVRRPLCRGPPTPGSGSPTRPRRAGRPRLMGR